MCPSMVNHNFTVSHDKFFKTTQENQNFSTKRKEYLKDDSVNLLYHMHVIKTIDT